MAAAAEVEQVNPGSNASTLSVGSSWMENAPSGSDADRNKESFVEEQEIIQNVFYSSRENVNIIHEVLRQVCIFACILMFFLNFYLVKSFCPQSNLFADKSQDKFWSGDSGNDGCFTLLSAAVNCLSCSIVRLTMAVAATVVRLFVFWDRCCSVARNCILQMIFYVIILLSLFSGCCQQAFLCPFQIHRSQMVRQVITIYWSWFQVSGVEHHLFILLISLAVVYYGTLVQQYIHSLLTCRESS